MIYSTRSRRPRPPSVGRKSKRSAGMFSTSAMTPFRASSQASMASSRIELRTLFLLQERVIDADLVGEGRGHRAAFADFQQPRAVRLSEIAQQLHGHTEAMDVAAGGQAVGAVLGVHPVV